MNSSSLLELLLVAGLVMTLMDRVADIIHIQYVIRERKTRLLQDERFLDMMERNTVALEQALITRQQIVAIGKSLEEKTKRHHYSG